MVVVYTIQDLLTFQSGTSNVYSKEISSFGISNYVDMIEYLLTFSINLCALCVCMCVCVCVLVLKNVDWKSFPQLKFLLVRNDSTIMKK
jgi:hypothetical protein